MRTYLLQHVVNKIELLIESCFGDSYRVEDAVIRYLNRKPVAGSDAPGSM